MDMNETFTVETSIKITSNKAEVDTKEIKDTERLLSARAMLAYLEGLRVLAGNRLAIQIKDVDEQIKKEGR